MKRPIVLALALTTATMMGTTTALADDLPEGWSARADATLVHAQSGATCPLEIKGFKRVRIESKGAPDLGVCTYAGDQDREGLVRVRQYVRGAGETPLAAQNDRMLMEPPPGSNKVVAGQRVGPGPDRNGAPTQQFVLTVARNGLLIDCLGRQLRSESGMAAFDFAMACVDQLPE